MDKIYVVAVGGLWACAGMLYIYNNEVSKKLLQSSLTQEALKLLREHKGALYYLDQPIKERKACFANSLLDYKTNTEFKVNVSGPKSNGVLFFSIAPDESQKFHLDKVQLQIGKDDSKRLIIKSSSNENSNS